MSDNRIVQLYYRNNYSKLCSSKEENVLSNWETLAYTCHSLLLVLLPLYLFGGYCILWKTPISMNPVKWSLLNWHVWCCIYDIMVTSLMTPYFFFPLLAGFPVGLLASFGVPVTLQLVISTIICYATLFSMVSVFENRFNILPLNKYSIKKKSTKIVYYGLRVLLFTINTCLIGGNFPDQNETVPKLLLELPCPSEEFFHHPVFVVTHEPPWREYTMALTVVTLSGEALQTFVFCVALACQDSTTSSITSTDRTSTAKDFRLIGGLCSSLLETLGSQIDVLEHLTDKDLGGLVDILCQNAPRQIPIVDTLCDVLRANLVDGLTKLVRGLKAQTDPARLCKVFAKSGKRVQ